MRTKRLQDADIYLLHDICFKTRSIQICSEIDSEVTTNVIKGIELLRQINHEPISIRINSFGGCPYAALSLYDYIRSMEDTTILTVASGSCMSAATIIWSAGDIRKMMPNAVLMFHNISSGAEGKLYPNLVDEVEECKRLFMQMCNIYEEHSNRSAEWWKKKIRVEDFYVRVDEAARLKLIKESEDE